MANNKIYSVSELGSEMNTHIKNNYKKTIVIYGEISNCKSTKIHLYFNLKDTNSSIPCVFWGFKNKMDINDGQQINATAYVDFYVKTSTFQARVIDIESVGIGNAFTFNEKIYKKYLQLGYFNSDNKKLLPIEINAIGIITALDGAALQDVLYVLKKHGFNGKVFVKGCAVQGKECPITVSNAIEELSKFKYDNNLLDVILITRGGGSYEDLIGFSDPLIIEAIYKSATCIISAVGHEVDTMISDHVADIRAPTPSIAGEIISYHQIQLMEQLQKLEDFVNQKIKYDIMSHVYKNESILLQLKEKTNKGDILIDKYINNLNNSFNKFYNNINKDMYYIEQSLDKINANLENKNPDLRLQYGNIITNEHGDIVKDVDKIKNKEKLKIRLTTGIIEVTVKKKWSI